MKKLTATAFLFFATILYLSAISVNDTIIIKSDDNLDRINRDLDSLVNSWYVRLALKNIPGNYTDSVIGEFPDSVYKERLSRINSIISLPYNSIIRSHIHVYTERRIESTCAILGLQDYYFPMIEDIFDSFGLPAELKYMAVIESALNPTAVSRVGATGMWQFLYSTGRLYGLTINSVVDERRDPVKATYAAARYLKDMYNIYHDWVLVIAAFNCGPGNVDKAIRRSGNHRDYWEIYYRLPRETRGYIPQFIAATYVMNYYKEHHIKPLQIDIPLSTDTIMVTKDIHLSQISEVMNVPIEELRALNPEYKTGFIPGNTKPQPLTLPMNLIGNFLDLSDTIRNHKHDIYLSKSNITINPSRSTYLPPDIKGKTKIYYTVKDGDNLGFISEWFHVGLTDLRYWNDIYSNTIRVGQRITIFVDPSKTAYYSKFDDMSFTDKQNMVGKPALPAPALFSSPAVSDTSESGYIVYTVQYGDTIWDIVKKFDNVTTTEVLALNNISDPGKIQVGQRLKIRKKT
ncbi:MAG: transglycosylase SLT domain-containing protein [Bacteroidales bacterium]|jgi:membrane-bound lytic murein transglycosylase D